MDYPCAKFGDCTFSQSFSFIVRPTDGVRQTESHTDADEDVIN